MGTAIKYPVPDWVKLSFDIRVLWRSAQSIGDEHQSARVSKTTNGGLTQSGIGCFIAVPIWQQWGVKGKWTNGVDAYKHRIVITTDKTELHDFSNDSNAHDTLASDHNREQTKLNSMIFPMTVMHMTH